MKHLAKCPGCATKVSRAFYFKMLGHARRTCQSCGCAYRPIPRWEWTGNTVVGLMWATFVLLARFGMISWPLALSLVAAVFAIGVLLFPYLTPFERVEDSSR
jgi:hypothetical protein